MVGADTGAAARAKTGGEFANADFRFPRRRRADRMIREAAMQRMTCAHFLDTVQRSAPLLEELARWDAIGADLDQGMLRMRLVRDARMSPDAQRYLAARRPMPVREHINYWLQMQLAVAGPKVFRPTLEQCLAMEQVAPRIAISDYAQPYPVMVIDLPEEYQKQRVSAFGSTQGIPAHAPACILIGAYGQPPWTIWLDIVFNSGVGIQWALLPTDATIEDGIIREFGQDSYLPADLPANCFGSDERRIVAGLLRLAVNAMLLLADFGCRHLGPLNPSHFRRLERYAALARRRNRGTGKIEAERNLRLAPQLYGFPQDIVLHGEERSGGDPPASGTQEEESHRRPHWRRGHWKMHAFGPGLRQRKRLFIKPVLVNRHLLREGGEIPQTVYRVLEETANVQPCPP